MDPITILTIVGLTVAFSTTNYKPIKIKDDEWPDTTDYYREKFKSRFGITDDLDLLKPESLAKLRKELERIANTPIEELSTDPDYNFVWDPNHPWYNMPLSRWARIKDMQMSVAQQREDSRSYKELGPFYASDCPVANAFGAELGFATRDTQANTVQRTGIGFYLRSDHVSGVKLNACTTRI